MRIGNGAYDQRQNDVFGAVLDSVLPAHATQRDALPAPAVAGAWQTRRECATAVWQRARPGHLGGARRAAALRLLQADVLGRAGPRRASWPTIRGDAGAAERRGRRRADEIQRRHPRRTASTSAASCASTTTPTRSTPRRCWSPLFALPARRRRARARHRAGDRRRAHRGRPRAALPHRGDRRRPAGEEGTFLICSFWLVSALAMSASTQRARDLWSGCCGSPRPSGSTPRSSRPTRARHLGNFPQAFSHLALIEAAGRIIAAEQLGEFT